MYFKRLFRTSLKTTSLLTGNYDNEEEETKRPEKEVVAPIVKKENFDSETTSIDSNDDKFVNKKAEIAVKTGESFMSRVLFYKLQIKSR